MVLGAFHRRALGDLVCDVVDHPRCTGLSAAFGGVAKPEEHFRQRDHLVRHAVFGSLLPLREPYRRAVYRPVAEYHQCLNCDGGRPFLPTYGC